MKKRKIESQGKKKKSPYTVRLPHRKFSCGEAGDNGENPLLPLPATSVSVNGFCGGAGSSCKNVLKIVDLERSLMASQNTTLDDIASVIGFSATVRLSAWFSNGSSLYIPALVTDDSLLVKLVGRSAAERLSKEWPKKLVWVPTMAGYDDLRRRRMICRMLEQKFGSKEIARTIGMSEKRVLQITRELEIDGFLQPIAPEESGWENDGGKSPQEITPENRPQEIAWVFPQEKTPPKSPPEDGADFGPQGDSDDALVDRD